MNSLKKKFGKYAVSNEKMAKVSGGIDDDGPKPNKWHIADCGGSLYAAATHDDLYSLVYADGATNCVMVA